MPVFIITNDIIRIWLCRAAGAAAHTCDADRHPHPAAYRHAYAHHRVVPAHENAHPGPFLPHTGADG